MRVLLVQPPLTPDGAVEPPVGLAALAAWLVTLGHIPQLLDLDFFQRLVGVSDWDACTQEFERVLGAFEPQVVGVTSMYSNSLQATRLISRAKSWRPRVITLGGGCHFGATPIESLTRHPALDFVIQGEGEGPLAEFLLRLETDRNWSSVPSLAWRRGGEVILNPSGSLIDMGKLPNPWHALKGILNPTDYLLTTAIESSRRVAYVEAGRGCPFACNFCSTAPFWDRRYRVKSVPHIIDEIRYLHEAGYDRFVLIHDLLTVSRHFISELCDSLLESRLPVEWMANARTDLSLDGLLPKLKAAGCWKLFFGIESASKQAQAEMNKHLDPEAAFSVIADLGRHGLTATCSFIIGFPNETPSEVSKSIQAGARMKLLGAEIVQYHRLRIWPPATLSKADLARDFDLASLLIEYPYLDVPADDLAEIAQNPDFFSGYFTPRTTVGDHAEVAQLEMFAHHAVALAPMSIYAIETLRPGSFVSAFFGAIKRLGPLSRAELDWDGGHMIRNWKAIKPYIAAMHESMNLLGMEHAVVTGLLAYEDERTQFATRKTTVSSLDGSFRRFLSTVNIPAAIRCIQSGEQLGEEILQTTQIVFRRNKSGNFTCFVPPPLEYPRP